MTPLDIAHQRLYHQCIIRQAFEQPGDIVRWLGAVQAQDYMAAQWALGLRLPGVTCSAIEQAFTDGTLLRTHVMRPTWHFVAPADIRWLLALTAPRVYAASAYYYRMLELDDVLLKRSNEVLAKALQGGKQLTREELVLELKRAGIAADNALRCIYIIMCAELDGVICSGARRGKQFTYALLDERVPSVPALERDEALATLARRYFTSHGPATLQDFVWWSGLTVTDARAGLTMCNSAFEHEEVDGQTYWFAPPPASMKDLALTAHLLPNFDEYAVAYTDRSAVFDVSHAQKLDARDNILFNNTMVLNGRIVGTWKRTLKKHEVQLALTPLIELSEAETQAFVAEAKRFETFLEKQDCILTIG